MRRRPLIAAIAASLCLGAAITILIAFACAAWSPVTQTRREAPEEAPPDLVKILPPEWLIQQSSNPFDEIAFWVHGHNGVGLDTLRVMVAELIHGGGKSSVVHSLYTIQAGWPFRALQCSAKEVGIGPIVIEHGIPAPTWLSTTRLPWGSRVDRTLPLNPLPGFALDTLLYAAACFTLFSALRVARRALRTTKGRCPACGYSTTGLPPASPCPECGTPYSPKG